MADLRLEAPPEPAEVGRYAVFADPDGSLVFARAAPLCEKCAACGCGDQAENIRVPAMLVKAVGSGKVPAFLKGLFPRG